MIVDKLLTPLSEVGTIVTVYDCHRCYREGCDPFSGEEWKYYEIVEGQPKLCQTHGKMKDGTGCSKGFSMWYPPCIPKILLKDSGHVKCKTLKSGNILPTEFNVLIDRVYDATISGNNIEFIHYLLVPSAQYEQNAIHSALGNLITADCTLEAGGQSSGLDIIDFDDCERAVGTLYAGQCALKCLINDINNSVSDRYDALVLYAWLGSLEASIDELVSLSPWASEFILEGMKKYYYQTPSTDMTYSMNIGDAVESLEFQLKCFYSKRQTPLRYRNDICRRTLASMKALAKSGMNCLGSLVVKFDCVFDEVLAEKYKTQLQEILRKRCVCYINSRKERGSIILVFRTVRISPAVFNELAGDVEKYFPDAYGIGVVRGGTEDNFNEDTDEYDVNFEKFVCFHSRLAPVIVKDTVSKCPLSEAVYCQSLTMRGKCCKNKTKDPSRRCWRHRG